MRVEVIHNGQSVGTHELNEGTYKIGRAAGCDIRLKSAQISKQHALLVIKGNKAAVVDLGSSNGVFVNGVLVRKQRVNPGDNISIVDFQIRVGAGAPAGRPMGAPPRTSASIAAPLGDADPGFGGFDGNLAQDMSPGFGAQAVQEEEEEPEMTPQEKVLDLLENKIMVPFYDILKGADWRWVLASILLVALVSSVLLSVLPIVRWGQGITTKEALGRAHSILNQSVRENFRILSKTRDYSRLTVEVPETEEGFLAVRIVDPKTKAILAPAQKFNQPLTDPKALAAMEKVIDEKEEQSHIQVKDNLYVLAHPINLYSPETNQPNMEAIIVGYFEVNKEITSTFEPMVEASLFAVLLSLAAFFFIYKMTVHPVQKMNEQLDAALKGEQVTITCDAVFPELQSLAEVMNFTVSRMKEGGGGGPGQLSQDDTEAEDAEYIRSVRVFDEASSDAVLLLDREKRVRFVGHVMEELINMRPEYAEGQNISDCCKDAGVAGTSIDMAESVINQLGATQFAQLDVNGVARDMVAVAHKNKSGEIRFVLLIIHIQSKDE